MVSIVIPARNEPYLTKTIRDILGKSTGKIEVIAVLDGYWPEDTVEDTRVRYIHFPKSFGMRNAINSGVAIAQGEFILKCDAHVMFDNGFDEKLASNCEKNWVVVPRRYALDPARWELIDNPKYPIDYMYLTKDFHGEPWTERNKDKSLENVKIDDLMSFQGSCWFMRRDYFEELELMDEDSYGSFANEAQEIGLKAWLSGGRVVVNKNTWYAHWHKTEGRGYSLSRDEKDKGSQYVVKWLDKGWHEQTKPLSWLIEHFGKVPTWTT